MLAYLIKRIVTTVLTLLGLLTVVFAVLHLVPGDPVDLIRDPDLEAGDRALIRSRLGLDRPLMVQYGAWLSAVVFRGDFGYSLRQHRPVTEIVGEAAANTLLLTLPALTLHMALAVGVGVWMARRRGRPAERIVNLVGLTLYSLPEFWFGLMLILVFARYLGWFPAGGMASPDAAYLPWLRRVLDLVWHLALPVTLLAVGSTVATARYVRNSVATAWNQDHILAARARGVPERTLLWRHALRNGLLPVITLVGLSLPFLLGASVVVETVFAWPGMGQVTIQAIYGRDYPVIMATTFLAGLLVVLGSLLADLLYRWADPRVRLAGEGGV
jgi:peptide/nickel transport system permease protein